jgi:hypothetical protein
MLNRSTANMATEILVYGATPGGIAAACVAAELGARVLLVEPGKTVGGHLTSGICTTECEHMLPVSFYGWMLSFMRQLGARYGIDAPLHRWEPKVAEDVYRSMLDVAGVALLRDTKLDQVTIDGGRIRKATCVCGNSGIGSCSTDQMDSHHTDCIVIEADYWIDASYEGDLMAKADIPYAVGREAIDTYGESLAGIRFIDTLDEVANSKNHACRIDRLWELDLQDAQGCWLDGIQPSNGQHLHRGSADGKVMNYHYRVTVTKGPNRLPFPRPPQYREERFELLVRFLHANPETPLTGILAFLDHPSGQYRIGVDGQTEVIPGDKWELNNLQGSVLSLGHLGGQFGYPDGDRANRDSIIADHYEHNAGLLYFLANSTRIPGTLRQSMQAWGLPPDEYTDNEHWPYQPYIRETRRMRGAYILTQKDILDDRTKPDGIYLNSHWIDCHHVQRLAIDGGHFRNEGRIWRELTEPYAVPYRSITPRGEDCTNLLVPGCLSASHVAFSSIRLESTWMGLGEAAGKAAVRALRDSRAVQDIEASNLNHPV